MSKKGETGERDRGKPQPQKKKDRNAKRKEKKSARLERQHSRQRVLNSMVARARVESNRPIAYYAAHTIWNGDVMKCDIEGCNEIAAVFIGESVLCIRHYLERAKTH